MGWKVEVRVIRIAILLFLLVNPAQAETYFVEMTSMHRQAYDLLAYRFAETEKQRDWVVGSFNTGDYFADTRSTKERKEFLASASSKLYPNTNLQELKFYYHDLPAIISEYYSHSKAFYLCVPAGFGSDAYGGIVWRMDGSVVSRTTQCPNLQSIASDRQDLQGHKLLYGFPIIIEDFGKAESFDSAIRDKDLTMNATCGWSHHVGRVGAYGIGCVISEMSVLVDGIVVFNIEWREGIYHWFTTK